MIVNNTRRLAPPKIVSAFVFFVPADWGVESSSCARVRFDRMYYYAVEKKMMKYVLNYVHEIDGGKIKCSQFNLHV